MIDLHITKSPIPTIIVILVLYWGSKRVIVSLKRNDPKSRPHAVPATQCAESAVFWKQSSFILKKTYLMLKISFYIVKLAQKSIKTHLKILGGKNFS